MIQKLIVAALFSTLFALPLVSQTDFDTALTRHKGNKIVLLGDWKGNYPVDLDITEKLGISVCSPPSRYPLLRSGYARLSRGDCLFYQHLVSPFDVF
jgi:hypothetical protein